MTRQLVIRNGEFTNEHLPPSGDLLIEDEKIVGIAAPNSNIWPDAEVIDATGKYVLPGLVDPHTHIQLDTGIYQTDDTWESGTKVAAYGGVTTVIDFATQFPGMSFQEAFDRRMKEAKPSYIDYGLHMMVTTPPDADDPMPFYQDMVWLTDEGITSIKLFTTYRPNYYLDDDALMRIMYALEPNMIIMAHCENDTIVAAATERLVRSGKTNWLYHPDSRPPEAEYEAAMRIIALANITQVGIPYIVHCSWAQTFDGLMRLRDNTEMPFYVETCPQYFWFDDGVYSRPDANQFIMQPPLRDSISMEQMLNVLPLFDVIATDHCDYKLSKKQAHNDFTKTPGGIPGLETSLQVTFAAYKKAFKRMRNQVPIIDTLQIHEDRAILAIITRQMSQRPAEIFGIYPQKGTLLPGADADVVIFDPKPKVAIKASRLHQVGGYNPYDNSDVFGKVETTISRGEVLVRQGKFMGESGRGRFVRGVLAEV